MLSSRIELLKDTSKKRTLTIIVLDWGARVGALSLRAFQIARRGWCLTNVTVGVRLLREPEELCCNLSYIAIEQLEEQELQQAACSLQKATSELFIYKAIGTSTSKSSRENPCLFNPILSSHSHLISSRFCSANLDPVKSKPRSHTFF